LRGINWWEFRCWGNFHAWDSYTI